MSEKEKINTKVKNRFDQVYWSVYLFNLSISELQIISNLDYNSTELKITNSHTFNFYRISLQYCIIMEYNKVLEEIKRGNKDQHISSLFQLNETVYAENKESFLEQYSQNKDQINLIKKSPFYDKMKDLRDKKYAHADSRSINSPFDIKRFSDEDFCLAFEHLSQIKNILNRLTYQYNFEYDLNIPHRDKRTENLIKSHAQHKDFYYKNHLLINR